MSEKDVIRLCPTCGAASVDFSALVGGEAKCRACGWAGMAHELLLVPVEHMYGTREGTGFALNNDYRALYKNQGFVRDFIAFLVKWGFVAAERDGGKIVADSKQALRYMSAVARSGLVAIVEEREKLEKEEKGGTRTAHGGG